VQRLQAEDPALTSPHIANLPVRRRVARRSEAGLINRDGGIDASGAKRR